MEDTTDTAIRRLAFNHGADVTFTEMARFESLARGNKSTWDKTELKDDTPSWIQIVGSNETQLRKYLSKFIPSKGFLGFNFNYGCPSPELINNGLGCAMIRRISKTQRLLKTVEDFSYKTSIKMRLGLNNFDKSNKTYMNLINAIDTEFFVLHTRVGTDNYYVKPDHLVLLDCVNTGKNIIANGDINNKDILNEVKSYGVKGVMIGRGAICNPAIFAELKGEKKTSIETLKKEYEILSQQFATPKKYYKNVTHYLGQEPLNISETNNG